MSQLDERVNEQELIQIPDFLRFETVTESGDPALMACDIYCERVQCQNACQRMCQNCLGTACQKTCQAANEGGCQSGCQVTCQNCMGDACQSSCQSGCQNAEGCTTTCERACQSCQGVACQTCQTPCETSCQNCEGVACQSGQEPAPTTYGSITSISSTATTITIRYTSIPNAVWYQVHYRKSTVSTTTPIANGSSLSCTITGLSPDTDYTVNYRGATATVFGPLMPNGRTIRTKPLVTRPDDWDWGYTVKPGARLPTAREWDNFCVRINEFRDYKGLSGYSFTKAYPGPTTLTADMVNQTITAIKAMSPSTSPPSSAVKNVTKLSAALLNGLAASLNSIR